MKKRLFASVLMILVAAFMVAGVTMALFTSEAQVEGNELSAGKLELTTNSEGLVPFDIGNIYPGQELEMKEFAVENSGSLPFYLKAVIESEGHTGEAFLPDKIDVTVTLSGANQEEHIIVTTLADLIDNDLVWQENETPLVIEAGETVNFELAGTFNLNAGNEYQEAKWAGKISVQAVQSDSQDSGSIIWTEEAIQ